MIKVNKITVLSENFEINYIRNIYFDGTVKKQTQKTTFLK